MNHLNEICRQANRNQPRNFRRSSGTNWVGFLIGTLCVLVGLALIAGGTYLGIWTMLIGGICQVIDAAKMTPTDSHGVAIGIVKAVFFELPVAFGWALGIFSIGCATKA